MSTDTTEDVAVAVAVAVSVSVDVSVAVAVSEVVPNTYSRAPQQRQQQQQSQKQQEYCPRKKQKTLSCWNASFTDCLLSSSSIGGCDPCCNHDENRDGIFILLDNVMELEFEFESESSSSSGPPVPVGGDNDNDSDIYTYTNTNTNANANTSSSSSKGGDNNNCHKHKQPPFSGFCERLLRELDGFLEKLTPARTQGDHKADEIMELLQQMSMGTRLFPDQKQQNKQQQKQQQSTSDDNNAGERVRGDNSIFISREYRQQKSFPHKHPRLHELISTVSNTFAREFVGGSRDSNINSNNSSNSSNNINNNSSYLWSADSDSDRDINAKDDSIILDFSMTSVQLALYPGDSKSGYRKHCDRQHSCVQEGTEGNTTRKSSALNNNNNNSAKPERLITCIYYLTDENWDAALDGGALRLFRTDDDLDHGNGDGDGDSKSDYVDGSLEVLDGENQLLLSSSSYTSVVPFRDRMVVFRSDRVQHQVMPSHRRARLAITLWFYGTIVPNTNTNTNMNSGKDAATIPAASDSITTDAMKRPITTTTTSRTLKSSRRRPIRPLPVHRVSSALLPSTAAEPSPPPGTASKHVTIAVADNDTNDDSSSSSSSSSSTIFVSIASYRDSETRPTIDALYSTALNPRRVFTGIVAQLVEGEKDDGDIWTSIVTAAGTTNNSNKNNDEFKSAHRHNNNNNNTSKPSWTPLPHQLRVMRLHANDATGPCYARGLCQTLYRGEDFVLQIDSHMRFRPNWDEYLIQTINGLVDKRSRLSASRNENEVGNSDCDCDCDCDKIMLTTYPIGYTLPNNIPDETRGTYLVPWKFDANNMLRQKGRLVRRRSSDGPTTTTQDTKKNDSDGDDASYDDDDGDSSAGKQQPSRTEADVYICPSSVTNARRQYLYAGGFNFGPARVVFDVPYDTMGLHHLFFGEELSMAVRLFTHGYDLYAPEETVCYHLWSRAHRPTNPLTVQAAATTATTTTATRMEEREKRLRELSRAKVKEQLLGETAMVGAHCGLGNARTAMAFAEHLGVDFGQHTFVREGWDCGELNSKDFVVVGNNNASSPLLFPADTTTTSVEAKVASLDSKAQDLIGMFLQGL
jgi:hypothetical protein